MAIASALCSERKSAKYAFADALVHGAFHSGSDVHLSGIGAHLFHKRSCIPSDAGSAPEVPDSCRG